MLLCTPHKVKMTKHFGFMRLSKGKIGIQTDGLFHLYQLLSWHNHTRMKPKMQA